MESLIKGMRNKFFVAAILSMTMLCLSAASEAANWEKYDEPVATKVVVRVLSHGAKAMSQSTGAVVIIREARTGRELDRGAVSGSTGDTTALVRAGYPRIRGRQGLQKGDRGMLLDDLKAEEKAKEKGWEHPDPYYDVRDERAADELGPGLYEALEDSASYVTVLKISKPTLIIVESYGPLMPPHATGSANATTWVFPGVDIDGEGIVLELRGLIVDALASLKEGRLNTDMISGGIDVPFYMRMMCGCPIAPAGRPGIPWEAEGFRITTQAYYNGELYYENECGADEIFVDVSAFKAKVPLPEDLPEGKYDDEKIKIRIMAAQPDLGNFGIDEFFVHLAR